MPSLLDPGFDPAGGTPLDVSGFVPGGGTTQSPKKKTDWKALAPLLAILPAVLAKSGKVGGAALLRGYTNSESQRREQTRKDDLDAQNAEYRQAALSSQAGARRDTAANAESVRRQQFLDKFPAGFEDLDSQQAVDAYLRLQAAQGATLGINEQDLRALAPAPTTLQTKAAKKKLAELDKLHGTKLMEMGPQFTYRLPGEENPITFDELLSRAGQARDPNYVAPPAVATDKRGFVAKDITLNGKRMTANYDPDTGNYYAVGDTKTPLTGTILEYQRPPQSTADPDAAAMRRETARLNLELLRQRISTATSRATTLSLSPSQRDALADAATLSDLATSVLQAGTESDWNGTGGLGSGTIAAWMAKNFGTGSQQAVTLRANISNIQGTIAKLRGGTSFTPNEQRLLEQYTPTVNEAPKVIMGKLKALQNFLATKAESLISVAASGPQDAATKIRGQADAPLPAQGPTSTAAPPRVNPFRR
ncbi:MAG: hypothetical protein RLZZ373_376 [Pseudomonadota bacterium]